MSRYGNPCSRCWESSEEEPMDTEPYKVVGMQYGRPKQNVTCQYRCYQCGFTWNAIWTDKGYLVVSYAEVKDA